MSLPTARIVFVSMFIVLFLRFDAVSNDGIPTEDTNAIAAHFCRDCHSGTSPSGDFTLPDFSKSLTAIESASLEKIIRRIRARQMPPPDADRPTDDQYRRMLKEIEGVRESDSKLRPFAGRPDSIRRLTRFEYQNAIRDLLAAEIDAAAMLPKDEVSHGFDNITVGELSSSLLTRYLTAAQSISRIAMGGQGLGPMGTTIRIPADRTQEGHLDGLPLGTRGGALLQHTFPRDGLYEFQLKLTRDRDEKVEGLSQSHSIDILIDRQAKHRFTVSPPPNREDYTHVDSHLHARVFVKAGSHSVGITFPQVGSSLLEIKRQPFDASYNRHRHPRINPALFEISIVGPFESSDPGQSTSRQMLLEGALEKTPTAARELLARVARRAYRRAVTPEDLESPMWFFDESFPTHGFDAGIESALTSILVNPHFLFRVETQAKRNAHEPSYHVSPFELASRLSFFLWSSVPDDRLLDLAEEGSLVQPNVLRKEVDRMLADPRSHSLVTNFASQWLYLRNLDSLTPDLRLFPDFDDNLRQAFRSETEHFVADVFRNNQSLVNLLQSDSTFLNDRLAKHYGVPLVKGSHFRKVPLSPDSNRGGLLRHGSILSVTSYATRTSPTIRGAWILENLLGTPPPPPPPNVPALQEKSEAQAKSVRDRLALHRANPVCASCHQLMDPIGFSLDRYDALGRWRQFDDGEPLDTSGILPDGSQVKDVQGLEESILKRPEVFVGTIVEKLLTYALGRGIELNDGPEVRKIVALAAEDDFRFASVIQGIVSSKPFLMRDFE